MIHLSPQQIVGGINRGDSRARIWIFETYSPHVQTVVQNLIPGSPEIQDIVQETFLKLYDHQGKFLKVKGIVFFLNMVAKNLCVSYQRHLKVKNTYEEIWDYTTMTVTDMDNEYRETLSYHRQLVYEAMKQIPENCRKAFYLHYVDELKYEEIAERLNLKLQTVGNRLTRARKILRSKIKTQPHLYALTIFL